MRWKKSEYSSRLNQILDEIFADLGDFSNREIAIRSGLHEQTIARLERRETEFPYFRTVYKLAKAFGYELTLTKLIGKRRTA